MATSSPMNQRGAGSPLTSRGTRSIGRSAYNLDRIAEQRYRQTGNPDLLYRNQYYNQFQGQGQGGRGQSLPPMPAPPQSQAPQGSPYPAPLPGSTAPPQNPGGRPGRFVPGSSAGAYVWQPDASLAAPPVQSAPPATAPAPMPGSSAVQSAPPAPPPIDFSNMMPPLPMATRPGVPQVPNGLGNMMPQLSTFDPMAPLPASTLMGGTGVPPPPAIEFRTLPGNPNYGVPFINGEAQKQFLPTPPAPGSLPTPLSAAEVGKANAAGFEPTQIDGRGFDAQGVPYLKPKGQAKPTIPTVKTFTVNGVETPHEYNPVTGKWRPVQFEDANGDGIDDRTQAGVGQSMSAPGATTPMGKAVQRLMGGAV